MSFPSLNTRKPLSRRSLLRNAGVTLALPLLESMLGRGWAAAPTAPHRFFGMMTNQGIMPELFFPQAEGKDYEDTPYLAYLKEHRSRLTVFSGVSLPGVDGGHAAEKSFLTGAPGASRGSFRNSISLDQLMAEQFGAETRFPSLALMVGSDHLSLSWTRSGSMIPPITSPVKLYQSLFGKATAADQEAAVRRLQADRSLLDGMTAKVKRLDLTAADRSRLDQYFTAIRDLEKRLAAAENWLQKPKPVVTSPQPREIANRDDLPNNLQVMLDLVKLALETDSTRVVTLCVSLASLTPRTIAGVNTNAHELTHHGNRPEKIAELRKIEEVQFQALARFASELQATPEQSQNLLDRTSVLFGTNMGSANAHSNDNLPVVLLGGGFKHVGHLAHDRKQNANLAGVHVSLLQRMGIATDRFASASSPFTGLALS
jgi:hypothetical protein